MKSPFKKYTFPYIISYINFLVNYRIPIIIYFFSYIYIDFVFFCGIIYIGEGFGI